MEKTSLKLALKIMDRKQMNTWEEFQEWLGRVGTEEYLAVARPAYEEILQEELR